MGIDALVLGAAVAGSGLAGSAMQSGAVADANEKNLENQRFINEQNERLTREAWLRDDRAVQRRKADLRAAGINPNLAAGSAAATAQPARMEGARVEANTAMGQGVSGFGRNFGTAIAYDSAMAQADLTKNMVETEKARYVSELAKSQKDLATAANMTSNVALRDQLTKIAKKDAKLYTEYNIDPRSRDMATNIQKAFPSAVKNAKKFVGEKVPQLKPYLADAE